jgi:alpha-ribazole phosphatase/probable phosphoglycerate mutase
MRLFLVRHAEAEESARGRCYGSLDVGLSAKGRSQCVELARAFASEPIAAVVSSPRIRAVETAAAIAESHGLEVCVVPDLRELDFGELEGRTYDEIAASLPELYAAWMTKPTEVRFPGGESYADLHVRSLAAVSRLRTAEEGQTVVAVTHGGVVRAVLSDVLGMPTERIFRLAVDPASITTIEWLGEEPNVRRVNSSP